MHILVAVLWIEDMIQMFTWLDGSDSDKCPGLIEATYWWRWAGDIDAGAYNTNSHRAAIVICRCVCRFNMKFNLLALNSIDFHLFCILSNSCLVVCFQIVHTHIHVQPYSSTTMANFINLQNVQYPIYRMSCAESLLSQNKSILHVIRIYII